jgi:hypothetical protein
MQRSETPAFTLAARVGTKDKETRMRSRLSSAAAALALVGSTAAAQTPLTAYTDPSGFLDVQKLTCGQLAGTFQEDADMLTTWYSGWYNGLAKKHLFNPARAKNLEHQIIVTCKGNPGIRIIDAIAIVFKDERARLGIQMKDE